MVTSALEMLSDTLKLPGQPDTLYRAFEAATQRLVGHRLFTLLYVDGPDVARVYSTNTTAYPVSGRKPMGPTPWGKHVLAGGKPYLGTDAAAVRWAFFDHALISSLGLGSSLNVPVVYNGQTIGTINLLDEEHHYSEAHVAPIVSVAPVLIPAFLQARAAAAE